MSERPKRLENVHCYLCKGTGYYGVLNGKTGLKSIKNCRRCKGTGRLMRERDSEDWKKGHQVIYGLGKKWRRSNIV